MNTRRLLDADMATVGRWLSEGMRWWIAELEQLLPARLRHVQGDRLPRFRFADDQLVRPTGGKAAEGDGPRPGARIAVTVPCGLCLARVIERPALGERDLQRMAAFEGDSLLPFPSGARLIAARLLGPGAEPKKARVEVAGLPLETARTIADRLAGARAVAVRVILEDEGEQGRPIDFDCGRSSAHCTFAGATADSRRAGRSCGHERGTSRRKLAPALCLGRGHGHVNRLQAAQHRCRKCPPPFRRLCRGAFNERRHAGGSAGRRTVRYHRADRRAMKRPISPRERRLIALLILVALIALVWIAIVSPILSGFSARAQERDELTLRYLHNQRTIAALPRLRRQAEEERRGSDTYVVAAHDAEAGKEVLKERLRRAVEAAGGEVRGAEDAEGEAGWARASVGARMTLPQLVAALDRLQNKPPWLVVETLSVEANDALVTGQSSSMDIRLEAAIPFRAAAAR
ncbi:MAG: type II secretion system protein GspM [Novosphingobium sp.]